MHMEKVLPDPRAAQVALALSHFGRATIEQAIDLLIERLDAADPDPDEEDDERATTILMRGPLPMFPDLDPPAEPDGLPGDPADAEEDDDAGGEITDEPHDAEEDFGADDVGEPEESFGDCFTTAEAMAEQTARIRRTRCQEVHTIHKGWGGARHVDRSWVLLGKPVRPTFGRRA